MDPLELIRSDFDDLEEYAPVKPLDVLASEIGIPVGRIVKLDANENLYGASPEVRAAVAGADFHIYPDPGQAALRASIAEYVNVDDAQIVAGTGADELIDILIRLVMPSKVAIATPTFGMYRFLAKIARAEPVEVPRRPNFDLDVVALQRVVHEGAYAPEEHRAHAGRGKGAGAPQDLGPVLKERHLHRDSQGELFTHGGSLR